MLDENSTLVFWDYCAERRAIITNVTEKYFGDKHHTSPHLERRETSQIYVNLVGMNGYIFVKQLRNLLFHHML